MEVAVAAVLPVVRGARRAAGVAVALAVAVGGCGDDDDAASTPDESAAYAAVVRSVAEGTEAVERDSIVFVAPLGDTESFPLDVQVAVVEDVGDTATVRFVDEMEEAFDVDGETAAVLDGGVLVRLGPVTTSGTRTLVEAERYLTAGEAWALEFELTRRGDTWVARPGAERPVPATAAPADG
jgi:hypothetical protein